MLQEICQEEDFRRRRLLHGRMMSHLLVLDIQRGCDQVSEVRKL